MSDESTIACDNACDELTALGEGTLSIEHRFRLGNHIGACLDCRLLLLITLDDMEQHGGAGLPLVKALAVLADVDTTRMSDWLLAMVPERKVYGAR